VSGILARIEMGKLGRLGLEPARRYERERLGELVHVDVTKLGRIERGAGTARPVTSTAPPPRSAALCAGRSAAPAPTGRRPTASRCVVFRSAQEPA
jgi:hypothetical protein